MIVSQDDFPNNNSKEDITYVTGMWQ